ncbi:hypothetical protein RB201_02560 [Streptomyces sp. S1A(2023)]
MRTSQTCAVPVGERHRKAEKTVDGLTEGMPAHPTTLHHRDPVDNVREPRSWTAPRTPYAKPWARTADRRVKELMAGWPRRRQREAEQRTREAAEGRSGVPGRGVDCAVAAQGPEW